MGFRDDSDAVIITEPILPKKDVPVEILAAESASWTVKDTVPGFAGQQTKAVKLTVKLLDTDVQTEHDGARPRLVFDQTFNIEPHPYINKDGEIAKMGRSLLYSIEEAAGFDPVFVDAEGNEVAPYITRTGSKRAPKQEGVRQKLNPAFADAYFNEDGTPTLNWAGLKLFADITVQKNEQYGDKNQISRFKKAPVAV